MIRVLRVLEYEYDTAEQMAHDTLNWTDHLQHRSGTMPRMRSSVVSITTTNGEVIIDADRHEYVQPWPVVDERRTIS